MNWIVSGTLPAGLTLDPVSGTITGIPTQAGTFSFTVTATDPSGNVGHQPYTVTIGAASVGGTPLAISPTILPNGVVGQSYSAQLSIGSTTPPNLTQVFPSDHILNTPIDKAPLLQNSAGMIAQMVSDNGGPVTVHPGFEIPTNIGVFPLQTIPFSDPSDSDSGPYPVPPNPQTEGGGDAHLLVRATDTNKLYEIYQWAVPPAQSSNGAIWDLNKYDLRPLWETSADGAGLPIFPLLIRYDEFATGAINHALRVTIKSTKSEGNYGGLPLSVAPNLPPPATWPARHRTNTTNTNPNEPSLGERFRLKASFDDSAMSPETRIITACLKKYGCIVADQGGSVLFGLQGDTNPAWVGPTPNSPAGVAYDSLTVKLVVELRNVNVTDFEVVDGVTNYIINADSGQAKQA